MLYPHPPSEVLYPKRENALDTGIKNKDYLECKFGTTFCFPWLCQLWRGLLCLMLVGSSGTCHPSPWPCFFLLPAGLRSPSVPGLLPPPIVFSSPQLDLPQPAVPCLAPACLPVPVCHSAGPPHVLCPTRKGRWAPLPVSMPIH